MIFGAKKGQHCFLADIFVRLDGFSDNRNANTEELVAFAVLAIAGFEKALRVFGCSRIAQCAKLSLNVGCVTDLEAYSLGTRPSK